MTIVRNSPQQLILRSVPWVLGVIFAATILGLSAAGLKNLAAGQYDTAAMMFLFGPVFMGIFFAVFVRRDDLILDRSRNLLELRHATVRGRRKIRHDLHHLSRAMVQTNHSNDGETYRVALVLDGGMDAGIHPVTEVYTGGTGAQRTVDVINAWLAMDVDSGQRQA
ncbi:hypothetical protein ACEWPN_21555 [Yoonia sp. R2-816]